MHIVSLATQFVYVVCALQPLSKLTVAITLTEAEIAKRKRAAAHGVVYTAGTGAVDKLRALILSSALAQAMPTAVKDKYCCVHMQRQQLHIRHYAPERTTARHVSAHTLWHGNDVYLPECCPTDACAAAAAFILQTCSKQALRTLSQVRLCDCCCSRRGNPSPQYAAPCMHMHCMRMHCLIATCSWCRW
jgi:hypothetical protein